MVVMDQAVWVALRVAMVSEGAKAGGETHHCRESYHHHLDSDSVVGVDH